MNGVTLGGHARMTARHADRERMQRFYRDVLGCDVIAKPGPLNLIRLGTDFHIGVVYQESAPSEPKALNSIWLELRADGPAELRQKILNFGVRELEFWDKDHFYFQAPGGQVFRLVDRTEDMSKWER